MFTKKINAFVGGNGVGKTNLLDAIYFLGLTKSFFNLTDQQLIKKGQEYFRVEATYTEESDTHQLVAKLAQGKRKELSLNEVAYTKISDHIGLVPTIILSPEDTELIHGSSENRRKLIDAVLSQVDRTYFYALIQYNKVLEQRNSLLKSTSYGQKVDPTTLQFYDTLLAKEGRIIYAKRKQLVEGFAHFFQTYYQQLCDGKEQVSWVYVSQLESQGWEQLFAQRLEKDGILQRTTGGTHRDDFDFYIGDEKIKKFGSQGQQKSFIIAMKLAIYKFIAATKLQLPILLLDDIFDKLDKNRMKQLIHLLGQEDFGQVFITDTDENRIRQSFGEHESKLEVFIIKTDGHE